MIGTGSRGWLSSIVGLLGAVAAVFALWQLEAGRAGLVFEDRVIGATPVRLIRTAAPPGPAPAVVVAHGFAGAKELMEPFAVSLARAGYVTLSFDFEGHGSHPEALPSRILGPGGAATRLIDQLGAMVEAARELPGTTGEVALLGHSMATDLIAKAVRDGLDVEATVAVSLFSPDVTATSPRNMLIIVGGYEQRLTEEALRVTTLTAGETAVEDVTYGSFDEGTARRAVFADGVEHVGVLFDPEGLRAAPAWLDRVFGRAGAEAAVPDARGPSIALLFVGLMALGWGLARFLPARAVPGAPVEGAGARPLVLLVLAALPMLLAPALAVLSPSGYMPLILGDYLAVHFLCYGLLTAAGLAAAARRGAITLPAAIWPGGRRVSAGLISGLFIIATFALTLDRYAFAFLPGPDRLLLIPILAAALLPWFLADEWLTRGVPAGREGRGRRLWAYALTKLCFVLSLGIAVALDTERLFFLLIVAPVILLFFAIYGFVSQRLVAVTGSPVPPALALSLALAWSIAASFPRLAG
ncbi:MAG: alpha/beta hydrolase [Pseudomonadota bacterium]